MVVKDINGEIIAFAILYVNREQGYALVNDVEVNKNFCEEVKIKNIYSKFIEIVTLFVEQYNKENKNNPIDIVACGISQRWPTINKFISENTH